MALLASTRTRASGSFRTRLPWIVLALAVLLAATQLTESNLIRVPATFVTTIGVAAIALTVGRRSSGGVRTAWMLIGIGMSLNAAGDIVWEMYMVVLGETPTVSWADPMYLATYPFMLAGIARLIVARCASRVVEVFIDAAAVALVAALVIWQVFVVNPGALDTGSFLERMIFGSYPMADVLQIAAVVALLVAPTKRSPSMLLMALYAIQLLAADLTYMVTQIATLPAYVGRVSDTIYLVAYGTLAASAMLDGRADAAAPDTDAARQSTSSARLVLLGAALCGAPALAVGASALGYTFQTPMYIAVATAVSLAVLLRIVRLVRRLDSERQLLRDTEAKLVHQASHDSLTGLPNRFMLTRHLGEEMVRTRACEEELALMFIDLDDFKAINDSLGHHAGDELLQAVAARLRGALRSENIVARMGGDEFVVLASGAIDATEALAVASRLLEALREPVTLTAGVVFSAASIGIAMLETHANPHELIIDADLALYRAKDAGGRCVRLFDASMRQAALQRAEIEGGLRDALANGGLAVAYQPRIDLTSGRVRSVEALVRWPGREGLSIPKVIDVAERTGLIHELGAFVLDRACTDIVRLNAEAPGARRIGLAVNVSMRQIIRRDFVALTEAALERSSLPPQLLTLEITETFLAEEPERARETLVALKGLGVRLEVDDFGTGYSSLARLSHVGLDGLKIDRSFVAGLATDPAAEPMVRAIVSLARALRLEVTVEGVETETQAALVHGLGCDLGQGFFYARPMLFAELARVVGEERATGCPAYSSHTVAR